MNKQLDFDSLNDNTIYFEDVNIGDYISFKYYSLDLSTNFRRIGQVVEKYSDIVEVRINNNVNKIVKCTTSEIFEKSKKIEELIKDGDYVNGMEVYKGKVASGKEKLLVGNHIINGMDLELANIKSIVTKEEFESIMFEV